jgi:hypothetical protein
VVALAQCVERRRPNLYLFARRIGLGPHQSLARSEIHEDEASGFVCGMHGRAHDVCDPLLHGTLGISL